MISTHYNKYLRLITTLLVLLSAIIIFLAYANPVKAARYKCEAVSYCVWVVNDFGPNQCDCGGALSCTDYTNCGGSPAPTGRYKCLRPNQCGWDPNDSGPNQCTTNADCAPQPSPVNGACSPTHYNCSAGSLGATAEYSDQWQWWCNGLYGGSNTLCSEMKLPVFASCTVSVSAPFNYNLSNSGNSNVTKTGGYTYTQNTITKTLISGVTQPVTLSLSGVPSGTSYSISNSSCSPTCASVITFTVSPVTRAGTYPITVTGSPLGKQTTFNLVILGNPASITCSASPSPALLGQTVTWSAAVSGGTPPFTYSWSGTNFPTSPAPSSNPFYFAYNTIGQKTASVKVTDVDDIEATCSPAVLFINFNPKFEEF